MTSPVIPARTHDAISERAAEFLERRRFGDWSDADRAELETWLAESMAHRAAYLRLEGVVAYAEELVSLRPAAAERRSGAIAAYGAGKIGWWRLPLLAAASAALVAVAAIPLANYLMQSPDRSISTDVGGRTLLRFTDGTEVELNTDSAIRFRMTRSERTVWLEKGEAWFHVSHDADHPFSVVVGRHRVTDLGTEFLVRTGSNRMEVALLAGRAVLNTDGMPSAMLKPGDDAVTTPVSLSITRKTPQELADALAWRRGVLVFRKTRLADVVEQFNRYNTTKLVIADPSIADVKITADLKTDHYDDFLQLAQSMLNLRVDREGNDILISRAAKKPGRHAP